MATRKNLTAKREAKTAAIAVGVGLLSYALLSLAEDGSAVDTYVTPVFVLSTVVVAAVAAHTIYRRTPHAEWRRVATGDGWLGLFDLRNTLGVRAIRKTGTKTRPRLQRRGKPADYGMRLGTIAVGPSSVRGSRAAWADWESSVLLFGLPGSGKTGWMIHRVIDAPGGILQATTKPDVYRATAGIRAQHGPVALFDPANLNGDGSSLGFNPVKGCRDHRIATRHASSLARGCKEIQGISEDSWEGKVVEILAPMLMAADLAGFPMDAVAHWVTNPQDQSPLQILEQYPGNVPHGWTAQLRGHYNNKAERMQGSIWNLAMSAVRFMAHPTVAASCNPSPEQELDIEQLVTGRGSLYLIGSGDDTTLAPLLTCLTDHVYQEATVLASRCRDTDGRLDPPFGVLLDEAAHITPVDIPTWGGTARGAGIYLVVAVQSLKQLNKVWGEHGAAIVWQVCGIKLTMPGNTDMDELQELSRLAGSREIEKISQGESEKGGSSTNRSTATEPVITPEQIKSLPKRHALVISSHAQRSTVVRFTLGQKRAAKLVRNLQRRATRGKQPVQQLAASEEQA